MSNGFKSPEDFAKENNRDRISVKNILNNTSKIQDMNREQIHMALATLGLTPGVGIGFDFIDAALYAAEGRYGESAISSIAMVPMVGQLATSHKMLKATEQVSDGMASFYRGVPNIKENKLIVNIDNGRGKSMHHVGGTFHDSSIKQIKYKFTNHTSAGRDFINQFGINDPSIVGRTFSNRFMKDGVYMGNPGRLFTSTNPRIAVNYARRKSPQTRTYTDTRRYREAVNPNKEGIIIRYDIPFDELDRLRLRFNPRGKYQNVSSPGILSNDDIVRKIFGQPTVNPNFSRGGKNIFNKGTTIFEDGIPEEFVSKVWYGNFDDFAKNPELLVGSSPSWFKNVPGKTGTKWVGGIDTHNNKTLVRTLDKYGDNFDVLKDSFINKRGTIHDIDIIRNELKPWKLKGFK